MFRNKRIVGSSSNYARQFFWGRVPTKTPANVASVNQFSLRPSMHIFPLLDFFIFSQTLLTLNYHCQSKVTTLFLKSDLNLGSVSNSLNVTLVSKHSEISFDL